VDGAVDDVNGMKSGVVRREGPTRDFGNPKRKGLPAEPIVSISQRLYQWPSG
jgi:hypothetical protein